MSEWQLIETAPQDGTNILAWEKDWQCPAVMRRDVYDDTAYWQFCEDLISDEAGEGFPTHWVPIPELPKGEGRAD
jgi:hypothetical protein